MMKGNGCGIEGKEMNVGTNVCAQSKQDKTKISFPLSTSFSHQPTPTPFEHPEHPEKHPHPPHPQTHNETKTTTRRHNTMTNKT
jgi:hypothetical protein